MMGRDPLSNIESRLEYRREIWLTLYAVCVLPALLIFWPLNHNTVRVVGWNVFEFSGERNYRVVPEDIPHLNEKGRFEYRKGAWWPLWALYMIPVIFIFRPLYHYVIKEVNWKAAWLTVLVFEVLLLFAEHYSLGRGHWVYNESRILGPKIFGIPIEEPLLYYLIPPLMIVSIMHVVKKYLSNKKNKTKS